MTAMVLVSHAFDYMGNSVPLEYKLMGDSHALKSNMSKQPRLLEPTELSGHLAQLVPTLDSPWQGPGFESQKG